MSDYPDLPGLPDFPGLPGLDLDDPQALISQLFNSNFHVEDETPALSPVKEALLDVMDDLLDLVKPDSSESASLVFMANMMRTLRPELARKLVDVPDEKVYEAIGAISERASRILST
jgi:hypothetical protein